MSSLPPPTGRPLAMYPRPDPWREQQRRIDEHRAARRRRRLKWALPLVALMFVAAVAGATFLLVSRDDAPESVATTAPPTLPPTLPPTSPPTTVAPTSLVEVGDVWLLDRGDEVYDWGLDVTTPAGAPVRSDVEVTVRLIDADDAVVSMTTTVLDGVRFDRPGTVAGRLVEPETPPVRLEFDVAVGVAEDALGLDALLETRTLERRTVDGDDEIVGRIRSDATADITDVTMVLVWRDSGEVVAVVTDDIDRIRTGVDARFTIDLADQNVPDGLPDDVLWSPTSNG